MHIHTTFAGYAHHGHTPPDDPHYMEQCQRHTYRRLERARQRLETWFMRSTQGARAVSFVHPVSDSNDDAPVNYRQSSQRSARASANSGASDERQLVSATIPCKKRRRYIQNVKCWTRSTKRQRQWTAFKSSSSEFIS